MTPAPTIHDLITEVQHDAVEDQPLAQLQTAAALAQEVTDTADAVLGYFVDQARRAGHSWSEIGEALGVSKQAAQQRHLRVGGGLVTNFERFTDRARRTVVATEFAARNLGHGFIGTEHVLLALFSEPEGVAAEILTEGGLDAAQARAAVTSVVGEGPGAGAGQLPYTPRAVQVFTAALGSSLELGHNYIGTEHLLLGLLVGDGVAAKILAEHGFTREGVLDQVQRKLAGFQAATSPKPTKKKAASRSAAKSRARKPKPT